MILQSIFILICPLHYLHDSGFSLSRFIIRISVYRIYYFEHQFYSIPLKKYYVTCLNAIHLKSRSFDIQQKRIQYLLKNTKNTTVSLLTLFIYTITRLKVPSSNLFLNIRSVHKLFPEGAWLFLHVFFFISSQY